MMPSSHTNLRVHFVWSTKNRAPLIPDEFEARLYEYIGGILRNRKHMLLAAGGAADHIHLLVGMHPTQSVSDFVRDVKTNSSVWIHDNISNMQSFSWQTGYGAFSVSKSGEAKVKKYITNQKEHHRTRTFQEEFLILLKRHEIEYDERYLWD